METGSNYKTFENRKEAAQLLLPLLKEFKNSNPLVVAIPRGAVPMAQIIAQSLKAPLDLVLVKKLGHPHQPELAIGAVSESGELLLSTFSQEIDPKEIEKLALKEIKKLKNRRRELTGYEHARDPQGRTVIIVDDGIATGSTMIAAVRSLKAQGAKRIIVAAPVASSLAIASLEAEGAETRIFYIPPYFGAVSYFYKDFDQVSDAEVGEFFQIKTVNIEILNPKKDISLKAILGKPLHPRGVVIFAHGSGSGRLSPRNQYVADVLNHQQFSTVLADLLTEEEAQDRRNVFDIDLLAQRLILLTEWVKSHGDYENLPIGFFGASTGAAAALIAASQLPNDIQTVISRGGRPDLAKNILEDVKCSVLLIVGGDDHGVIELNQMAYDRLNTDKKIEIIPGATHLFEEPGALEQVADCAYRWLDKQLVQENTLTPNFYLPPYP